MSKHQTKPLPATILIVDDSKMHLRLMTQILSKPAYTIRTASDGHAALSSALSDPPDLILLDIVMPGIDGYQVCRQLKEDERTCDIPVIFISSMGETRNQVKAFAAGGVDFVTKPFQAEEVLARVQTHLTLRNLQKGLETLVAQRTAEIEAEKEKSDTILRSAGDAIGMIDLDMRVGYINPAFTTLTGYTPPEIAGQPIDILLKERLPAQEITLLRQTLARGESWQGEMFARRQDGRTYKASMIVAPMHDATGKITGYVSSHQNISHLEELEQARSRFITNISHELRTPVANIKLYAGFLQKGAPPEKNARYHQVLVEQAERLENLVQDIIEITSLDSGQAVTTWEPISPLTITKDVIAYYQNMAQSSGIKLESRPVTFELPEIKGDQSRLTQALGELVENAITFTPGGGEVTIEIKAVEKDQRWLTIAVSDTGPGISVEEQERVFDRFFRGSQAESGHVPGTGLGLSIAQGIVKAHGGQVTVQSPSTRLPKNEMFPGSTFIIWLRAYGSGGINSNAHPANS